MTNPEYAATIRLDARTWHDSSLSIDGATTPPGIRAITYRHAIDQPFPVITLETDNGIREIQADHLVIDHRIPDAEDSTDG